MQVRLQYKYQGLFLFLLLLFVLLLPIIPLLAPPPPLLANIACNVVTKDAVYAIVLCESQELHMLHVLVICTLLGITRNHTCDMY